jgi:hypothetical protein
VHAAGVNLLIINGMHTKETKVTGIFSRILGTRHMVKKSMTEILK